MRPSRGGCLPTDYLILFLRWLLLSAGWPSMGLYLFPLLMSAPSLTRVSTSSRGIVGPCGIVVMA
jgi:hypothetical protein